MKGGESCPCPPSPSNPHLTTSFVPDCPQRPKPCPTDTPPCAPFHSSIRGLLCPLIVLSYLPWEENVRTNDSRHCSFILAPPELHSLGEAMSYTEEYVSKTGGHRRCVAEGDLPACLFPESHPVWSRLPW